MDVNNDNSKNMVEDDGSLSFLNLPRKEGNKQFHCEQVTQADLINKTFWTIDYQPDVKTKFGEGRYLVYIKFDKDDDDSKARKFFTGSTEIKNILDMIKERNAFPRRVTMRMQKQAYWIE